MDSTTKKSIKKQIKSQELELRKIVAEFDPLGIGAGFPEDEYDDLVDSIISILNRKDYSMEIKMELLTDEILRYSDLSIKYRNQISRASEKILKWWQNQNSNI